MKEICVVRLISISLIDGYYTTCPRRLHKFCIKVYKSNYPYLPKANSRTRGGTCPRTPCALFHPSSHPFTSHQSFGLVREERIPSFHTLLFYIFLRDLTCLHQSRGSIQRAEWPQLHMLFTALNRWRLISRRGKV